MCPHQEDLSATNLQLWQSFVACDSHMTLPEAVRDLQ